MGKKEFDGRLLDAKSGAPIRVTMDQCPRCDGIWFDQHEAELTMGVQASLADLATAPPLPYCAHCGQSVPAGKMTCTRCQKVLRRTCPPCGGPMNGLLLFGVHLDRCPKCSGLWFDGGELQAVHEAAKGKALPFGGDARHARCKDCHTVIDLRSDPAVGPGQICARCNTTATAAASPPVSSPSFSSVSSASGGEVLEVGITVLELLLKLA